MVEIEHRALGPFEQDRSPLRHRPGERNRHVADPRPHAGTERPRLREDVLPAQRLVLCDTVAAGDAVAHEFLERRLVEEIAHAQAPASRLVLVRRSDAARGRADHPGPEARLAHPIQIAVVRQDDVRAIGHEQAAADVDPGGAEFVDLVEERLQVDDHTVPDHARDAGVQDAGGNEAQDELAAARVNGVARVVPALIARHDREPLREQIHDLALALVSPLCADNGDVHGRS